ncbi:acyl-CoA thioesterase [Clavibacter sepedonicus]|uniref:acyl-CoA thioesterase n=1 Tax=Clavibacter sepedonicus TaxID=31964 RepID=UPI003DA664F5
MGGRRARARPPPGARPPPPRAGAATGGVWPRASARPPPPPAGPGAAPAAARHYSILESIYRRHGLSWATPGIKAASLDHAMWFHRFGRADEWMLYVQESTSAQGGRGLSLGRIYSRDGVLLASVAQEGMVRVPLADRA